jgi:hypothetical protein
MNKQEFLAMSLPYGLKVVNGNNYNKICDFTAWSEVGMWLLEKQMPILRPLSDLTKEIEHKGERFVPIVELAMMAWEEPLIKKFKINNKALRYNFDGNEYYF